MPKETKFTLCLLLLLGSAFGFLVWQKVSHQTAVLAEIKERSGDGHDHGGHRHNGHVDQRNPFDAAPVQTAQHESPRGGNGGPGNPPASFNPFDEGKPGAAPRPPQQSPPPRQNPFPPGSPGGSSQTPSDLFSPPQSMTQQPNGQAPSKSPFPQANPFDEIETKTVQAFPASQTRVTEAPKSPFDENPKGAFPQQAPPSQAEPPQPPQQPKPQVTSNPFKDNMDNFPMPTAPPSQTTPQAPVQTAQTNPFDEAGDPRKPQPPATFNPFNEGSNLVPVKHAEKQDPPPKDPFAGSPKQGGFPTAQVPAPSNGKNPFDEADGKPSGGSNVSVPPKFNMPTTTQAPAKPSGGFSPFDENPEGGFAQKPSRNPTNPPPRPNPNPNPAPYDPSCPTPHLPPINGPTPVYKVQMDETYWSISEKHYGSIRYFQALAEFNRHRVGDPKKLRPGMIIYIPEATELERLYTKLIPGSQKKRDEENGIRDGLFYTQSGVPMYRVGEEDTLSDIAQKHLGRSTRWVEIYNLNREAIKTADRVKVGTVLRMPSDASTVSVAPEPPVIR
ncbi:LysM peptidoglycan-binding domain-containing protein [Rubinisphaera margarita]|uniref:LysM peptidoglycan-binding domain-containing protein n=1 Tax=Rubinisphaera margarita TaxID=2909586 RepID=UPI001EE8734C|nr:LysM domain-containing protein [Rubinisphaera margarita]MCG6157825.1 LysM peptidoglycan-binding domain-containing protein [Rubinisphaera margarita]